MSEQKKKTDLVSVVGVIVCILAMVGIYYKNRLTAKQVQERQDTQVESVETVQPQPVEVAVDGVPKTETPASNPAVSANQQLPSMAEMMPLADVSSPIVPVFRSGAAPIELGRENDMVLSIDPDGYGISSVTLPQYALDKQKDGETSSVPVVLGGKGFPFLSLSLPGAWHVVKTSVNADGTIAVVTRANADENVWINEKWDVSSGKPGEILYTVEFQNNKDTALGLSNLRIEGGAMPASVAPDRKAKRGESAGGLFLNFAQGNKVKEYNMGSLSKMKLVESQGIASTAVNWAAVHSKYFVLAFWRNDGNLFPGAEVAAVQDEAGVQMYHARAILPDIVLQPGEVKECKVAAYAGGKNYERLYALDNKLDSVMQMNLFFFWRPAWMGFISRWLLRILVYISSLFPPEICWGLAIILLTVGLKILFWPLTHKSTVSMRKMSALKPEIDKIRAAYKDNPQMIYRKQQELMKANGVSQMGGCLPMLLQIPVFFALFNTFRNAIELRHSSFLWAYDLSMPDTVLSIPLGGYNLDVRPFALMMGVGMYFQQKMTPNADPNQAKMMSYMTIFFIFLFYGMPSALTLYMTVTYVLGVLQTWAANRSIPKH